MGGGRRLSYRSAGGRYGRLPSHAAPGGHGHAAPPHGPRGLAARVPWGRVACAAVVVVPWAVLLLVAAHIWREHRGAPVPRLDLPGAKQCIGWRETYFCNPYAERYARGDKGCDDYIIPQISGYCLCEGNITTARVTCGPKRFTCRQKCAELAYNPTDALVLPTPITCPYDVPYLLDDFLKGMTPAPADWAADAAAEHAKVAPLWEEVYRVVHAHGIDNASAPMTRNETHDFVREGYRIPQPTVAYVRSQLTAFQAALPAYPVDAFSGRGVVTVGGGMRYIIPAWMMVHQLRHLGCRLPIEMWFPISEYPSQAVVDAFEKLGVTSRKLEFRGLNITSFKDDAKSKAADPQGMARFTIKVAALLLSRFQEAIYFDADNIPLRDPAFLFETEEYNQTGALMWQDFWDNTVAPEAEQMLGVPRDQWPKGSFESGQMAVDKKRHWRGLLTATWFNSHAHFWYEIFTCFLGKGDKETFAYGMAAAKEPYYVMPLVPGALGTTGTSMACNHRTHLCRDEFTGNTMVQYDASGAPLFLHSNLHKWDMRLPEKFSLHYQRRWQVLLPGHVLWEDWMRTHLGYDLEHKMYEYIRMLRCMPWWDAYYESRVALGDKKTPELDGFHYLLRGIELPKLYRAGWTGGYEALLGSLSFSDWRHHEWNRAVRPRLAALGLARRWQPQWDGPS